MKPLLNCRNIRLLWQWRGRPLVPAYGWSEMSHVHPQGAITAFAGVDPSVNDSGDYSQKCACSKHGSPALRKTLYQVMDVLIKPNRMIPFIYSWTRSAHKVNLTMFTWPQVPINFYVFTMGEWKNILLLFRHRNNQHVKPVLDRHILAVLFLIPTFSTCINFSMFFKI